MSTPRALSQLRTRTRLLDASEALFLESGFRGSSIAEIARRAGLTRGAFYANYDDKQQLLIDLLRRRRDREATELAALLEADEPLIDALKKRASMQADSTFAWVVLLYELRLEALRSRELREAVVEHERLRRSDISALLRRVTTPVSALALTADEIAAVIVALDVDLDVQHLLDPDTVDADLLLARVLPALLPQMFEPPERR